MPKTVLIVSNSEDAHANVICKRLQDRAVFVHRLDSDSFTLAEHVWRIPSTHEQTSSSWAVHDVDTVWYRKVVFPDPIDAVQSFISQELEGLFESLLEQYRPCHWINAREAILKARPKIAQLQSAKKTGFRIPDTIVVNRVAALAEFSSKHNGKIVAKPMRAQVIGHSANAKVVGTRSLASMHFEAATRFAPCYAQEHLQIKSEIRVVAFGEHLFSFRLTPRKKTEDLKQLDLADIKHESCELDNDVSRKIRTLMKFYRLEFAAIDLVTVDDGEPIFLELNPNGQWLWLQYMTGVNLIDPFIDLLKL